MRLQFIIDVEVERESGKFATKDDIRDVIAEWLDGANEGTVDGVGADGESVYNIADWAVS